jgi:hypothetical protein
LELLATPFAVDVLGGGEPGSIVAVSGAAGAGSAPPALRTLPVVLLGPDSVAPLVDVVAEPGTADFDAVVATGEAQPLAATALALLLRGGDDRSVADGLVAESVTYSMLQGGPEFARWRASRPVRERAPAGEAVRWTLDGSRLDVVLARPQVHNAYDSAMRDGLIDALTIATTNPDITEVHLSGEGPSFCSGGDLDEFGSRPDPATAHLIRLARSAARLMHQVSDRVIAHLHGACMGSGIELPAFAGRVLAAADTRIALPEIGLGLIPGAGGTVSLPRRIGRHRTAFLALSGTVIDADTALDWGLVDALE